MILDGILARYDSRLIESEKSPAKEFCARPTRARQRWEEKAGEAEEGEEGREEEETGGATRCTPGSNCDGTDATLGSYVIVFATFLRRFLEVAFDSRTLSCPDYRVARRSGGDAQVDDANGVYVGQVRAKATESIILLRSLERDHSARKNSPVRRLAYLCIFAISSRFDFQIRARPRRPRVETERKKRADPYVAYSNLIPCGHIVTVRVQENFARREFCAATCVRVRK